MLNLDVTNLFSMEGPVCKLIATVFHPQILQNIAPYLSANWINAYSNPVFVEKLLAEICHNQIVFKCKGAHLLMVSV